MSIELDTTEWKPNEDLRRIVCAANRLVGSYGEVILLIGPRHWDETMRQQYIQMNCKYQHSLFDQGFIDQFGKFHHREEALIIARKQNQIYRELDYTPTKLYSEMLY